MLSKPGSIPTASGWSFELKWDGFRAIVSTGDGLRVRSRRGWDMTEVLPELRSLPNGLMLDGELVAWKGSEPCFPVVCRRVLNRDMTVPITFVAFDLLAVEGEDITGTPYIERRRRLEALDLSGRGWATSERFEDGHALFTAACKLALRCVVAKSHTSLYRPRERGWGEGQEPELVASGR